MATPYTQQQLDTGQKALQRMLTAPAVARQYADILQRNQDNMPAVAAWLAGAGYPGIDPTCIYIALEQMRNVNQACWTGVYDTAMTTDRQFWVDGGTLIIQGKSAVTLGGDPESDPAVIKNPTFSNSTLSWTTADGNGWDASIAFTPITGVTNQPLPPGTYLGPQFSGTLTQPGTAY